jgi:phospholipase C
MLAQTHPSQGNYIAMIAGDKLGVNSDSNYNISANQRHLGNLLEEKGLDWKVYAEGFPGNCFTGASSGKYARKHVPFISFLNVSKVPDRCAKIVNSNMFMSDWSNHRLPAFSMYVPDLNNDGHDTGVGYAATWFQKTFGPALKDSRLMDRTLVILTFDESEGYFGANKIYTAMYSPQLPTKMHIKAGHTHYSLLKFIEDEWALGNLGRGDSKAAMIQELKAKRP